MHFVMSANHTPYLNIVGSLEGPGNECSTECSDDITQVNEDDIKRMQHKETHLSACYRDDLGQFESSESPQIQIACN
jgi:hypothetical protein